MRTVSKCLTTGSSEFDVGSVVVVNSGLGQHGVVFDLGAAKVGSVVRQNHQLSLAASQLLDRLPK